MRNEKPIFTPKDFKPEVLDNVMRNTENLKQKVQLIKDWQKSIHNKKVEASTEIELQALFLHTFFGEILGYAHQTHLTETQLRSEVKTAKDQTKADGALGYFAIDTEEEKIVGDVRVVIELKKAGTDLDKKQGKTDTFSGSPVEQGFDYATKFGGKSEWIVISDFVEIRLYHISDSDKYELFKITELLDDNNLAKFLFLLQKDRLFLQYTESPTKLLLNERRAEEIKITNEFYNGYRDNRETLFYNLLRKNPTENPFLLLAAAQKLMDRLVFVCFVHDAIPMLNVLGDVKKMLLLKHYKKDTKIWSELNEVFVSFDEGYMPNIPQFNGGLFKPDSFIDSLVIKDDFLIPLIDFLLLYDFQSQLNVSILGHIFEQSIADLEELRVEIAKLVAPQPPKGEFDVISSTPPSGAGGLTGLAVEDQISTIHNNISKRKKDGIFYTPNYVTKYMLEQTIGEWLEEKKQALLAIYETENATYWIDYEKILQSITVIDPACGSGAFLNAVFDYLWAEWKIVIHATVKLGLRQELYKKEEWQLKKAIVLNNLYGVDLNMESVEITKLSLWLQTASAYEPLSDLTNNIKRGNSLIDDKEITEWAFDWKTEFPQIFDTQTLQGNQTLQGFKNLVRFNDGNQILQGFKDLVRFNDGNQILQGFKNLVRFNDGESGFDIVVGNPPYVRADLEDDTYQKQRKWITDHYEFLYEKWDLMTAFYEQALKNLLKKGGNFSFISSNAINTSKYAEKLQKWMCENFDIRSIDYFENIEVFEGVGVIPTIIRVKNALPRNKIKKNYHKDEFGNITSEIIDLEGVINKQAKIFRQVFQDISQKIDTVLLNNICYISVGMVINADELTAKGEFTKDDILYRKKTAIHTLPIVEGKDLKRYKIERIKYLEWGTERVPAKLRRTTFPDLYTGEKILRGRVTGGIYDNTGIACNDGVMVFKRFCDLQDVKERSLSVSISKNHFEESGGKSSAIIAEKRQELESISVKFTLKYLLAIINSNYAYWFLNNYRRHRLENYFYPDDFRNLPIPAISLEEQQIFVEKVEIMLSKGKELQKLQEEWFILLPKKLKPKRQLTKKLENWFLGDYNFFVTEMQKVGVDISKLDFKQRKQLNEDFEAAKPDAFAAYHLLEQTDKELNQLVYKLYDLREEEIKMIEKM